MLDVKFELVQKSLSLSQLHWTTQKSKILAQKSFFERPVLMYSWSDLASSRTVWDNFFWSLTMFVFERSKTLYFCVRVEFFQKQCLSHLQRIFAELVHTHTKKMNYQLNVVLKKTKFMLTVERTKSFSAEPVVFEKTFWIDPSCKKRRNFEISIFCFVWEEVWNEIAWNSFPVDSLQV